MGDYCIQVDRVIFCRTKLRSLEKLLWKSIDYARLISNNKLQTATIIVPVHNAMQGLVVVNRLLYIISIYSKSNYAKYYLEDIDVYSIWKTKFYVIEGYCMILIYFELSNLLRYTRIAIHPFNFNFFRSWWITLISV